MFLFIYYVNSVQSNFFNSNNQEVHNIYPCFYFMLCFLIHIKRLKSLDSAVQMLCNGLLILLTDRHSVQLVFHMDSNSSMRCLVFPCRICRKVLYLSLPNLTFSAWIRSFAVFLLSSQVSASSELRACKDISKPYVSFQWDWYHYLLFGISICILYTEGVNAIHLRYPDRATKICYEVMLQIFGRFMIFIFIY